MSETFEKSEQATSPDIHNATSSPESVDGRSLSDSLGGRGTDQSGPEAVPASHSAPQVNGKAKLTTGTSGQLGLNLSKSADRPSFSENRSPVPMGENGSQELRTCNVCSTRKPLSEFYRDKDSSGGYRIICKECCRGQERRRKAAIPAETRKAEFRKWRKTNRAKALMTLARFRAKQKGLPFALDENAIQGVIDAGVCELTRIPFNLDGGKTWDSPSLDRIDSSKGYTPDNVRVVLYCLNVMANIWGENKIIEMAEAIMAARRSRSADLQDRLESALKRRLNTQISPEYELTWKHWDMPSGPPILARRASGRRTSGSGFTGWPSPNTPSGGRSVSIDKMDATGRTVDGKKHTASLEHAVKFVGWPTPQAHDTNERGNTMADHHHYPHDLSNAAMLAGWNTPRATDGSNGGPNQANGALSHDASLTGWATPSASGFECRDVERMNQRRAECKERTGNGNGFGLTLGQQVISFTASIEKRGALNPEFSRWLMGFPPEWGSCAPTAMRSCLKRRRSS